MSQYNALNELATAGGTVIFGGTEDRNLPLCELKQAFALESELYNRSVENLSIVHAKQVYNMCVAELKPECILLHIGTADLKLFSNNSIEFINQYCEFIHHIKSLDKSCRIVIVSLENSNHNHDVEEMNKQLKYIADSEQCEFGDISIKRVWYPNQMKDVLSFVYSLGLKKFLPVYDLVQILFSSKYRISA